MIKKTYEFKWVFEAPEAILACSIIKCKNKSFLTFGGHDRNLYLMNQNRNIVDSLEFDGWIRCIDTKDIDGDGCDEIICGTGDGNFLVIKIDLEKEKLLGIKHYMTNGKIFCCVAEDITRNGQYELVFGGDNNKLVIFRNFSSELPQFIQHYESWVTACNIGLLRISILEKPIMGLLIGTKNGLLQLLYIENENLRIFWHEYLGSKINDIKIADVNNNGFNEIITCSDDSKIRIYNSDGELLSLIFISEARPLSLLIKDIDGDNANEIIAGCADGTLYVYQNNELNSLNFNVKWSAKAKSSIQDITSIAKDKESIRQIIFGGYDRTIRNIVDYEWGEKEKIEISEKITLPKVKINKQKDFKSIPTNLEIHIKKLLKERKYVEIDNLIKDLRNIGYSLNIIKEKINGLQKNNKLITKKQTLPVWHYVKGEGEIEPKKAKSLEKNDISEVEYQEENLKGEKLKPKTEEKPEIQTQFKKESYKTPKEAIIEILEAKGTVPSKADLIELLSQMGFSKSDIISEIETLNDQNTISYSHTKPRGWSLISNFDSLEDLKEEIKEVEDEEEDIEKKIVSLFKKNEIIRTKSDLIDMIVSMGHDEVLVKDIIEHLNEGDIISYSRSKPRGWILLSDKLE